MKLQLNDYDKIIFDLDGVITSELSYWYGAALTAYELLVSYKHYGVAGIDREWIRKQYKEVYNTIMCGGRTVKAVKRLGVNTNWDLCHIVFCVSKYLNPDLSSLDAEHFQSVCMFIENIDMKAPELYNAISALAEQACPEFEEGHFKRDGEFFEKELMGLFDEWYLGCDEFDGLREDEELLLDPEEIENVLKALSEKGIKLGIGTGRPRDEAECPLLKYDLYKYFDKELVATYDEIKNAEESLNLNYALAKPDPFVFLKAALGKDHSDKDIIDGNYTYGELDKTLVVGDALSDLLAANKGGFDFLGVLTGVDGEGAREWLEENKADYVLDSILNMI